MKGLITIATFLFLVPALTLAQDTDHPYRGQGYGFFGLGTGTGKTSLAPGTGTCSCRPVFEGVGFGGEGFLYKGLGVGAEAAYVSWGTGDFHKAWVGSADFSYHFGRHAKPRGGDPFVLGGLSVVGPAHVGNGRGTPAGNFGGGANLWITHHAALRFEFRDVVGANSLWLYHHYVSFRLGMTFR
jgi:hypothetical protein